MAYEHLQTNAPLNIPASNQELIAKTLKALSGKWGIAVWSFFASGVISQLCSMIPLVGLILCIIIAGPLAFGIMLFTLNLVRGCDVRFEQIFAGFKIFERSFTAGLLVGIFTLLWTLLLIIPGIIAVYAYSMTFYILADDPDIDPMEAIRKSKQLMQGNKWRLCCLQFELLWWVLLLFVISFVWLGSVAHEFGPASNPIMALPAIGIILLLSIGSLWYYPYLMTAQAEFYDDLIKNKQV